MTPPDPVFLLFASQASSVGAVRLDWVVPGEDGAIVTLPAGSAFYIQYSTYLGAAWSAASAQVVQSTSGVTTQTQVNYTVGGLDPGATYYFSIWNRDDAGNFSSDSNIASFYARPFPAVTINKSATGTGTWHVSFSTGADGYTSGLAADSAGNTYVSGFINNGSNVDIFIHKYDPSGNLLLAKYYNGEENRSENHLPAVAVDTASGDFYMLGAESRASPAEVSLLIKYNAAGQLVWKRTAQGNSATEGQAWNDAKVDASGNIYVCGSISNGSDKNSLARKYDPAGNLVWASTYAFSSSYDWCTGLVLSGGYVYGSGTADMAGIGQGQNLTAWKLDINTGLIQWTTYYTGAANLHDDGTDITADASGNIYIVGDEQAGVNDYARLTQKRNSSGVIQWTSRDNYTAGSGTGEGYKRVVISTDNYLYEVGLASAGARGLDVNVSKRDLNGNLVGTYLYDLAGGSDLGYDLQIVGDKIVIAGEEVTGGVKRHFVRKINMSEVLLPDTTAPAAAALAAVPGGYVGALTLQWGAPGDDGSSGALAAGSTFYVQYSTYAGAAWNAASAQVLQSTSGVTPPGPVAYAVGGLDPGTTYYLAVWHRDEAGNLSAVSNIASAYARPFPPPPVNRTVNGDGTWQITLPVVSNAFTTGLAADATGNIYVAGIMHSGANEDIFLHKYDASGNLLLAKYYNGEENFPDSAYPAVAVDTVTGAFYLAGHEFGTNPDAVGLLIKYDASGQMVWKRTAQGNSATTGQGLLAVALDGAGAVYVGGQLSSGGVNDSFVRKYTPSGGMVWSSTLAFSPSYDWVTSLALRDGYIYAAGSADMAYLGQGQNATLWKLDATTGLTAWTTHYNSVSSRHDDASGVAADASGYLYLVGNSQVAGSDYAMLLQKRSAATGAIEWTSARNYAAGVQDSYVEIRAEADGSVYSGGTTGLGVNGNIVISKYDAAGNLLGEYTYDVDGGEDVLDNLIISGGKVIISGSETYGGQKRHFVRQVNQSALAETVPPTQAVLQPVNGGYVNSLPAISGTAADNVAVSSVTVSLKRQTDGYYWNGTAWAASQTWLNAALWPSSWTYTALPAWVEASSYTVVGRAIDASGNWSAVYSTSSFIYQVSPGALVSLSASSAGYVGALTLAWNAPGDNGYGGTLAAGSTFYVQYSTFAGAAWNAATAQVVKSTSGVTPLAPVSYVVGGLDPGTTYYLAVWHRDAAGNLSAVSNIASAYARPFPALAINKTANPDGTWHVYFPAGTTRYVAGLAADASGYAYVAGHVSNGSNEDLFVHKYDPAGNLVLAKYYNGPDNCSEETDTSVAVDGVTGAFYLAGRECAAPSSMKRLIIKYDASGQLVWKRTASGGGGCERSLVAAQVGADGSVYVGGNDNANSLVAKYGPDGGLLWSYEHAFSGSCDITYGLAVRGGYVYAVGSADMSGSGRSQDGSFWKLNAATGETLLASTYDLAHFYDEYFGVAVDTSGYLYVAGDAQPVVSDWALLTQKLDMSGTPLWTAVENKNAAGRADVYRGIVISTDNYLYQAGVTTNAQGQDILVTKRGLDGTLLGINTIDVDGGEDAAHGLTLAGGNVVVYGHETLGGQKMHFVRSLKPSSLTLPDTAAPAQAVLQPVNGTYLSSLAALSGTAADNVAVSSVAVSLKRQADGYYWNGAAWAAPQAWVNAALWPSSWTYTALPAWAGGASYAVTARAADTSNNWSTVYSTSVFYYDNGLPSSAVSVPAAGSVVTSFSGLAGTAADAEFQVAQVWVKVLRRSDWKFWNGAAWADAETWNAAAGTSAWSYSGLPASALDSGATYYAVSRAADLAGNMQISEALVSTFSYLVQQFGPAPFTGVGASSLTVNWTTNFYGGTTYYLRLSTVPSEGQYGVSAATTSHSLAFTGLVPNTSYYAYVATAPAGGYAQVAVGITRMETPADIYFDEVEATRIVASAYAPAFHNLGLGQSGINVAISSAVWVWNGWGAASAAFPGLTPNTLYSFKAKARNQAGIETGESVTVSTYTLALPPGSVSASVVSSRAVNVSWDRGANPPGTMFEVSYSTVSSLSLACAGCVAAPTTEASLVYSGLSASTTYYFRVRGFNSGGVPTLAAAAAPALTLPPPPGAVTLAGTAAGVSSITWNWNAAPDAAGYRVFTSSGDNISGDLGPGAQAWTETGLLANTRYIRLVRADNVSGYSISQEASRYTLAAVPGAPAVTVRSDTVLELDWASGGNPEPGTLYQLLRSTSPDFSPAVISTAAVSSAAVSGLQPDRPYHFRVRAVNGDGLFSAFSAAVSTATLPPLPAAPPAPSGQVLGVSSITWSWAASPAAGYYRVYAGGLLASPATTYYTRSGLAPNTTYSITVSGVNELGEGAASPASAPLSTLAMPPLGAGISAVYITSATLSWGLGGNPLGTSARVQRLEPAAVFSTQGTAYTDTGLLACTTYYFRVWNVNRDGLATPYSAIGPVFTGVTPPPPPGNLAAVSLAVSRIYLSWDPSPSEGITAYNLYFDDGTGAIDYASPLATVPAGQNGYTTGVLTSSAAYKFGLRALHRCGVEEKNTTVIAAAPSMYSLTGVRAAIKIPQTGKRVNGNSVTVMAEQVTGASEELKNVRFQYKAAAAAAWLNIPAKDPAAHPNPDSSAPYFIHWDVSALAPGMYNLRAVASDFGNTADPTPAYITITVDPVEAEIVENASGGKVTKEQVVNNLVTNVLQAGDPEKPQVTRLEIPAGALDASTATVAVTNNPAVLPPEPPDAAPAGVSVEVNLSGQSALAGGQSAVVTLMFPDADGDGTVDGTNIRANQLQMYSAHSAAGPWQRDLASEVDLVNRKVTGHTTHFSFFALFAPQAAGISSARAYPVPWRPGSGGRFDSAPGSDGITFDNLTDDSVVYIYTITGQLVRELRLVAADLGVKVWDGRNSDGRKAASGVYLARIKSGSGTRTLKIVVER